MPDDTPFLDGRATPEPPDLSAVLTGPNGLAAVFDMLPLPVLVTRIGGVGIVLANRAARLMFSLEERDLAAFDIAAAYVRPEDRAPVLEALQRRGWIDDHEIHLRGAGGRLLWVRLTGRLMRHRGEPVFLVALHDVTERRAAEAQVAALLEQLRAQHGALETLVTERTRALEASERLLSDVLHTSSDWLWETGPDHSFTGFSAKVSEVLGIDPETLVGRNRFALADTGAEAEKWRAHRAALERREPFRDFTYCASLPNGLKRHLRISGVPKFDAAGGFEGYRGVAADISQSVRQQEDLARATVLLESTLRHMEQGLAVFDRHLRLAAFNDRFRDLFFLPEHWLEIGSASFQDLIRLAARRGYYGDADPETLIAGFVQDVEQRGRHRFERRLPDGRWVQVNRNPLPDGGIVITATDVTALKEAERGQREALQEAGRARQQLLDAIEAISDGFILWDADDRLVLCNSYFRTHYADADAFITPGAHFLDVIDSFVARGRIPHGHTAASWRALRIERHRNPGPPYVAELQDGRVIRITDQRTQDGGLVSLRSDVTQLMRHERALEENRRLMRAVIDAVPAMINVKDLESRYVLMNRLQGEVYRVDPERAIGHTSGDFVAGAYGAISRAKDLEVIRTGQAQQFTETDFVDPRGESHTWFTAKLPLKDDAGAVKNVVTVALDVTQLKRVERARANLARHFAPNMVDLLAEEDEPFGPARTQFVAVLFADIIGFTRLCELLAPKTVFALLRDCQSRLAAEVFECRGTLDKYIGDGLMATFGTPYPSRTDPRSALRCARRMQAAMAAWNRERQAAGAPSVRLAVGVHYGPALLGNIGSEKRLEFAVIGDTVNVANRLERMARELDTGIVVSGQLVAAVREEAGPAAEELAGFRQRGAQAIRGRAGAIEAWTLD